MKTPTPSQENRNYAAMFHEMATQGGGPAYPIQMEIGKNPDGEPAVWFSMGMTKREHIAMAAMQGRIASFAKDKPDPDKVAEFACQCADALLERLKK